MNNKVENLVRHWFLTDLDVEVKATKNKKSMDLIFESDVYYYNGKRYKGYKRRLDVPNEADDDLYEEIEHLCGFEMGIDETLDVLFEIEELGFSLN